MGTNSRVQLVYHPSIHGFWPDNPINHPWNSASGYRSTTDIDGLPYVFHGGSLEKRESRNGKRTELVGEI